MDRGANARQQSIDLHPIRGALFCHKQKKQATIMPSLQQDLLDLPVVCLSTANFDLTLKDAVEGKRTVIGMLCFPCCVSVLFSQQLPCMVP